ncbi:choice-of-anchor A family protein [Methylobacillus gramineus]|uniref:choice-of-anchor A family protein n=1 Tax=Methylobacillus gramineus TaxID=755169 RepID=UPI001D000F20|nr:choice-of-anchor A family protein [Methylobacillus gramineus]MCB5184597.1 choice-of-anchor A family protein [Methylobacillus gramineus]
MKMKLGLLAVLAVISAPATAGTIDLGVASDYNAFIFGDYTTNGNSTAGALAIGGSASLNGHSIGNNQHNDYAAVIGGNLGSTPWGGSANGSLWVGGTNNKGQGYTVSGQVDTSATVSAPVDFAAAQTYLTSLSSGLASVGATGSYAAQDQWNQASKIFTGSGSNVEFFSLNASEFSSFNNLSFSSIATGTTLIFNVAGTSATLGWQWQSLGSNYNVLFNFYEATSVTLQNASLYANILAVDATINGSGNLYGTVVGESWNNAFTLGNGGFATANSSLFAGVTAAVPEPSSYALLLAGLVMIGFTATRRKRILARM